MADGGTATVEVSRAEGLRQFTSAEFYRLGEIGVIGFDERVELVDGLIYKMAPINPRHANAVDVLAGLLTIALDGRARVRGQNPVHLDSERVGTSAPARALGLAVGVFSVLRARLAPGLLSLLIGNLEIAAWIACPESNRRR